jgi:hypothetical protein
VPPRVLVLLRIADVLLSLLYRVMMYRAALDRRRCIPYHTSALSGADWVDELLTGHPERIRVELGIYRSTFIVLLKAMYKSGVQSS